MSTIETTGSPGTTEPPRTIDKGQFGLAALLLVVGGYLIYDGTTLTTGFADPVGPQRFPYVVGAALIVLSVLLAIATLRGDRAEGEDGEDIDLSLGTDWLTVLKLIGVFVLNILFVNLIGWAITGGLLFAGSAWALGSRTPVRDLVIGGVMSVSSWYFFWEVLGIPLTPGILDGIL